MAFLILTVSKFMYIEKKSVRPQDTIVGMYVGRTKCIETRLECRRSYSRTTVPRLRLMIPNINNLIDSIATVLTRLGTHLTLQG